MNRAEAVHAAIRSMQLEGFEFSQDELDAWQKVANGEMSLDDLLETFVRFDTEMRQRYPELYEQEQRIFEQRRHRSPKRR